MLLCCNVERKVSFAWCCNCCSRSTLFLRLLGVGRQVGFCYTAAVLRIVIFVVLLSSAATRVRELKEQAHSQCANNMKALLCYHQLVFYGCLCECFVSQRQKNHKGEGVFLWWTNSVDFAKTCQLGKNYAQRPNALAGAPNAGAKRIIFACGLANALFFVGGNHLALYGGSTQMRTNMGSHKHIVGNDNSK